MVVMEQVLCTAASSYRLKYVILKIVLICLKQVHVRVRIANTNIGVGL